MDLDDDDGFARLVYRTAYDAERERHRPTGERLCFPSQVPRHAMEGNRDPDRELARLRSMLRREYGREIARRAEPIIASAVEDAGAGRRPRW